MANRRLIIATLLGSFGVTQASAQRLPQVRVPPTSFHANWNDRLPTAGGELLGLMGGDPAARIASPTLVIGGIDDRDATICVAIRQVSGAYSASFAMKNPHAGRKIAFLLPPQKIRVSGLSAAELAVLARASSKDSCARDSDVLPAGWNGLSANGMVALVNTHQADRTRTMAPRGAGDCERLGTILPGRALTSYQVACRFVPPSAGCAPAPLAIQLENAGEVSFIRASLRRDCP